MFLVDDILCEQRQKLGNLWCFKNCSIKLLIYILYHFQQYDIYRKTYIKHDELTDQL